MRKFTLIFCTLLIFASLTSCSTKDSNDSNEATVIGTWELTTWTIQEPIDLNNDSISSLNLLDEAMCDNHETLIFEANGTVSSNMSYNPQVTVSLLDDDTTNDLIFNVICDMEGSVGTAGSYTQNTNSVFLFNTTAVVNGNQLTLIYEDVINIYNEELTDVLTTKDLKLVYTKK